MINAFRARIESLTGHQDFRFVSERSFAVMLVKAVGAALALAVQVVLARVLGVNEFGVYAYALSWAMIFVGLSRAGMDLAIIKYIPIHRADNEPEKIRGLIVTALGTLLVAFFVCMVIGAACIAKFVHPDLLVASRIPLLYASIFFVMLFSLGQIFQAILRGIKHLVVPEIMDNIIRPLALILLVIVFHRFLVTEASSEIAAGTAMTATAAATGITCAIMARSLKRDLRLEKDGTNFSMFRDWFGLALPMMMMVGVNDIIVRIDILMVGKMLGPALAGIYSVSTKLAELSLFGLNAANGVLSPLIAEYHHAGQNERLQKILASSAWIIFFVTMLIALALCIAGPFILPLFGKEFTAAYVPMLVLLAGQLVNALTGPLAAILVLSGHQMQAVKILICKAILNFSGNFLLIPMMGITGAAIAAAVTITFTNLALFYYVYRLLGLNPSIFSLPARQ